MYELWIGPQSLFSLSVHHVFSPTRPHKPSFTAPLVSSQRCGGSSWFPIQRELNFISQHLTGRYSRGPLWMSMCEIVGAWIHWCMLPICLFAVVIFPPALGNYDQPGIQRLLVQSAAWRSCLFIPVQRRIMRLCLNDSSGVCCRRQ